VSTLRRGVSRGSAVAQPARPRVPPLRAAEVVGPRRSVGTPPEPRGSDRGRGPSRAGAERSPRPRNRRPIGPRASTAGRRPDAARARAEHRRPIESTAGRGRAGTHPLRSRSGPQRSDHRCERVPDATAPPPHPALPRWGRGERKRSALSGGGEGMISVGASPRGGDFHWERRRTGAVL